jgi:hypothetical protein
MRTGDMVRVYHEGKSSGWIHIHPGVDVYLYATSKNIEAAGENYVDQEVWIKADNLQVLKPQEAVLFTETTQPVTMGRDPDFSTLNFYERAMKNPDPVVRQIVGPRLIDLISYHNEYMNLWTQLYRDPDSRVRSLSLASLKKRGVGNSRLVIEDLIKRLSELTRGKARGEQEAEAIMIIEILADSQHPRALVALQGYEEAWAGTQSIELRRALHQALHP